VSLLGLVGGGYHHTSSSFASIERTFARVHEGQIHRVREPPRASTTSAHQASGGSPSSLGSAIRPQIAQISPTEAIRTLAVPAPSSAARAGAGNVPEGPISVIRP
jgi:hypothetical protein